MYDIGRKVYVKSLDEVGFITEAHWVFVMGKRRASYVVEFRDHNGKFLGDWLTNTSDLRGADWQCDGCGRHLPGYPHGTHNVYLGDGSIDDRFHYCFLCVREQGGY